MTTVLASGITPPPPPFQVSLLMLPHEAIGCRSAFIDLEPADREKALAITHPGRQAAFIAGRLLLRRMPAGHAASLSHGPGVTICVHGPGRIGADIAAVGELVEPWPDELSAMERATIRSLPAVRRPLAFAAIWAAREAAFKCRGGEGLAAMPDLSAAADTEAQWLCFTADGIRLATLATALQGIPMALAIASEPPFGSCVDMKLADQR